LAERTATRKAILVEGDSDVLAVQAMARRLGRDLDREGIAVVNLGGGGGLEAHLERLVPTGVEVVGLCDLDHERRWARKLEKAGLGSELDRAAMEALGFYVCDRDLEDELVRALGVDAVERLIAEQGDLRSFQTLTKQPYHRDGERLEQLRRFLTSKSSRHMRYIPLLVEALEPGTEPRPLRQVLERA
jgi:predicted ATP-dependent endonuclease of OLD family